MGHAKSHSASLLTGPDSDVENSGADSGVPAHTNVQSVEGQRLYVPPTEMM
jgi:hypothetical protein